jgi:hypothetical protein
MKYHISINQRSVITNGLGLDLVDMAIVDYCRDFFNSPKTEKKANKDGSSWYWIDYRHLMNEMPILGIQNQDVLARRIWKIVSSWVLERFVDKKNKSRTYLKFGKNYELLVTDLATEKSSAIWGDDSKVARQATQKSSALPISNQSRSSLPEVPNNILIEHNTISKDIVSDTWFSEQFFSVFREFEKHRTEKRNPLTATTKKKMVAMLKIHDEPTAIAMLEQSMRNGWVWLFELKENSKNSGKRPPRNALTEDKDYSVWLEQFQTITH